MLAPKPRLRRADQYWLPAFANAKKCPCTAAFYSCARTIWALKETTNAHDFSTYPCVELTNLGALLVAICILATMTIPIRLKFRLRLRVKV